MEAQAHAVPACTFHQEHGDDVAELLAELRSRPDANPCTGMQAASEKQKEFMKKLNVPMDMIVRVRSSAAASTLINHQLALKAAAKASKSIDTRSPQ